MTIALRCRSRFVSQRKPGNAVECGKRVYIVHPATRDADEFIDAAKRSKSLYKGVGSPPDDVDTYRTYLERSNRDDRACFLVRRLEHNALVGTINLGEIVRFNLQCATVGYNAFLPHAGCGYMTEGLQLVLKHAFGSLKLHRVEAGIQPENVRSIALVKRCGFECEGLSRRLVKVGGRWRDHERWSILKEDWQAQRRRKRGR